MRKWHCWEVCSLLFWQIQADVKSPVPDQEVQGLSPSTSTSRLEISTTVLCTWNFLFAGNFEISERGAGDRYFRHPHTKTVTGMGKRHTLQKTRGQVRSREKMGGKPRWDVPTDGADAQLTAGTPSKSLVKKKASLLFGELPLYFNGPNTTPQEDQHSTLVWCWAQQGLTHACLQLGIWLATVKSLS